MDTNIRTLLAISQKYNDSRGLNSLKQAFDLLKHFAENKPTSDGPDTFGQDLYVLAAELSFQHGKPDMSKNCLKMYFMKTPPTNQFLCRAYLCQAQLLAPTSAENVDQLEKAVVYLVKAISMAKENSRYHFLVYNASVLYWQFCRPFLKPNYRRYLARSLHQVVKALDDIEDKDYEWRAQLMIALIECHMDAGNRNDASHIATAAATFIKQNVPNLYKKVFGLMVRHQLVETTKLQKDIRTSPELHVFYRICRLKQSIENKDLDKDVGDEMRKIIGIVTGTTEVPHISREQSRISLAGKRSVTPDEKGSPRGIKPSDTYQTGEIDHDEALVLENAMSDYESQQDENMSENDCNGMDTVKNDCKQSLSESQDSSMSAYLAIDNDGKDVVSGAKIEKFGEGTRRSPSKLRRSPTPTGARKVVAESPDKDSSFNQGLLKADPTMNMPYLLLELARFALDQNIPSVAQQCVNMIKDKEIVVSVKDSSFFLEVEFLQCDMMVKNLGDKQESYGKSAVELRLQAIKRCDEVILNALRLANPNVLQAGCVSQWNLCLPLLQANLRQEVRRPLTLVAEALGGIQSLLVQLRCQVHMELAKCEEDQEQIQVAIEHLKKALALDDGQVYHERLMVALHRLELRSELYKQPERLEDQAAMIIEQARKADSGTMRMKRSLLVRAGQALAPDAFLLVLESESDTKEVPAGKGPLTQIKKLAGKAQQFKNCVKKAEGHLRRLGNENDRERARLWGDLAKTARKQEVWDVCRVACRFCLLYDDGRWKNELPPQTSYRQKKKKQGDTESTDGHGTASRSSHGGEDIRPESPDRMVPLYDKDLLRMMGEVNFVNGEGLIHLLRSERVELGDKPIPPEDKSKRPKGYVAKKPEEDPDWIEYCEWIDSMSKDAVSAFSRAVALGEELNEAWIVCSAAAYVWNYHNHTMTECRHNELVDTLQEMLAGLKKVGHAGETVLLVNICTALAEGLVQPWVPPPPGKDPVDPNSDALREPSPAGKKGGKAAPAVAKGKSTTTVTVNPDATPDLKNAVEVCEYAMKITNGDYYIDVVPIAVRLPLLQTWVKAKQLLQSQIEKSMGCDNATNQEGQNPMTRAIVAVEMLTLNGNAIMEFKEVPPMATAVEMVENCSWTDKLVELQLWTRLAALAVEAKDHKIVTFCACKALEFAENGTAPKGKKHDSHKYLVEQEMLSFAASIYGQSLIENTQGKNSIRRQAMKQFLDSACFARNADNGEMVMQAARHYWNASLPLINQPIERELLKDPVSMMLECISDTTDKSKYRKDEDSNDEDNEPSTQSKPALPPVNPTGGDGAGGQESKPPGVGVVGGPDDDLTLRASLYGVLFQAYADKGEWEAGLKAMDQAIQDMPRTNHRLLIFKHLVVVKAKLGLNVAMSIQKFKDESEDYVAHMWRRVALCSKENQEQLQAYQNAIEALNSPSSDWQKFDYLLEFGQWLYCNEFPLQDAIDMFEWAIDILLNMKIEIEEKREEKTKKSKGTKSKRGKSPTGSAGKKAKSKKTLSESKMEAGKKSPTSDARTASESDMEINAADYVPVHKEVVIDPADSTEKVVESIEFTPGILPNNTALTIRDVRDVRQLEGLFRAHILLAQICGRNSIQYADYCLMAYAYLMRMWQVSLGHCGPVIKELAKRASEEEVNGKASAKGKKDSKKDKEPVKEKPKRKGPLDHIPETTEAWATFDAPDEAIEAFKQNSMKQFGINTHTITKPALTMLYLDIMTTQLRDLGYNHLALPVLAMADVLSRDLLPNRPLFALVHSKSLEVCVELNLNHGANFHEKLADCQLNEEEQTKSREEMALWKEKQLQVAKEEARVKKSMEKLHRSSGRKKAPMTPRDKELQAKIGEEEPALHLGQQISSIENKNVWTNTAEVLLNTGQYQPARELLNEAHQIALAFEDKPLVARILYLLARVSFHEAQYGQTVSLCVQAQHTYDGNEMFWYDTTVLMVDAQMADYTIKARDRLRMARGILVHALNVFHEVSELRPNKLAINGFIMASMEAKLGTIQASITLAEHDNMLKPKVMSALVSASKKLQHGWEKMLQFGFRREAIPIIRENVDLLIKLARVTPLKEDQHDFYVQALNFLKTAMSVCDDVLLNVHSLAPLQEMRHVSSPVQREATDIKIVCGELMLEIFQVHMDEEREKQEENFRKGSVLRAVEEMVRETPDYSSSEQDWINMASTIGETALIEIANAHSLSGSIPELKTRSLYNMGKCLRLLSLHKSPDPPGQWNVQAMEVLRVTEHLEKSMTMMEGEKVEGGVDGEKTVSGENDPTSKEYIKHSQFITKLKNEMTISEKYLAQATECLTQALNMSLQKDLTELAGMASLELVECFGQYEPALASNFLSLHQSCQSSRFMEDLLYKALMDPTISRQASMFHQRKHLLKNGVTTNNQRSSVMKALLQTLEESSEAWKRLAVMPTHLDLLKEFPPNFNFIVMQHSPDKKYLYGAILDRPKPGGAGGKGQKHAILQGGSKAKVVRVETSPQQLEELLTRWKWYKHDIGQVLLKQEYQRTQLAQREKMLANLEGGQNKGSAQNPMLAEMEEDEKRLDNEFVSLLEAMEDYLKPITAQVDTLLRPASATTVSNPPPRKTEKEESPQEYVVLLADHHLMEMPLEALKCLQVEPVVSLSREISLQMLHHKNHVEPLDEAAEKAKKEKEKNKAPSRLPGLRDANKKMAKIIPLDRPIPPGCLPVDTHAFRFFVDPHLDCSETEEKKPVDVFNEVMEEHVQQFTPRWLGIMGDEHIPSPGEYEIYALESSAVIFYGMERFLGYLPPHKVAALNLPDCQFAVLLDQAQTNKSFSRQAKIDVLKNHDILALEKPVEAALLLSLTGMRCIYENQWYCTMKENASKLTYIMKDLLAKGKTTGQSIRMLCDPPRRRAEEKREAEAAAEADPKAHQNQEEKPGEGGEGEPGEEASSEEEVEEEVMTRSWYNMVCYGLPNMIVTQIGKA